MAISRKENKVGGITLPGIKPHESKPTETARWRHKNRHAGQGSRTERPEINPHAPSSRRAPLRAPPTGTETRKRRARPWHAVQGDDGCHSATKACDIPPAAATRTGLPAVTLSEMSQTEKDERHVLSLTCGIKTQTRLTEHTLVDAGRGRAHGMRAGVECHTLPVREEHVLQCDGQRGDSGHAETLGVKLPQTEPRHQPV